MGPHWECDDLQRRTRNHFDLIVLEITQKYLPEGSRVLEEGCCFGGKVNLLKQRSYDAYGADYARNTVKSVNLAAPDLEISVGDTRHLDFPAALFEAYWFLGVIEGLYDGSVLSGLIEVGC